MIDEKTENIEDKKPNHWQVLSDLFVFQFKLALDGIRDLILSPVSIISVIYGLITQSDDPGKYYARLLKLGSKSDSWINLFNHADQSASGSSDEYIKKLEALLVSEYHKGGVIKTLKEGTDELLNSVKKGADSTKQK